MLSGKELHAANALGLNVATDQRPSGAGFIVSWGYLAFIVLEMRLLSGLRGVNSLWRNLLAVMLFLLLHFLVVCDVARIGHGSL